MMAMFGCGAATDPKDCLADKADTTWGVHGTLRLLKDVTYQSSYWTRSSPDGRFVAHGVANVSGSYVLDLERDATIPIDVQYDPGFFPDNAGFVFQGGSKNVCAMSVLTSNPVMIGEGRVWTAWNAPRMTDWAPALRASSSVSCGISSARFVKW